jgi:hypothetical protein
METLFLDLPPPGGRIEVRVTNPFRKTAMAGGTGEKKKKYLTTEWFYCIRGLV